MNPLTRRFLWRIVYLTLFLSVYPLSLCAEGELVTREEWRVVETSPTLTEVEVEIVTARLIGTVRSLDWGLEALGKTVYDLRSADFDKINARTVQCFDCNIWKVCGEIRCDEGEETGDGICNECRKHSVYKQ